MRVAMGAARRGIAVGFVAVVSLAAGCAPSVPDDAPRPARAVGLAPAVPPKQIGAPAPLDPEQRVIDATLASWTLEETLASLIMVAAPGVDPAPARALLDRHGFGGFIVMGSNVSGGPDEVARFVAELSADPVLPVLTAVDQEGGDVRRLAGDTALAGYRLHDATAAEVEAAFATRSALVDASGVGINFGIVADVSSDPAAFIHRRVLGRTPADAAERVAAAVRGEGAATLSTLKHFPGHGASPDDSHVSIPRSSISLAEWRDTHALPFRAGIAAGAELVMTGHLQFDAVSPEPASLSSTWVGELRNGLAFDGVIVTDDLLMLQRSGLDAYSDPHVTAVRALRAGNDVLLFVLPADHSSVGFDTETLMDELTRAVVDGTIDEAAVRESAERVLALRRSVSGLAAPDCGPKCAPAGRDD